MVKYMTDMFLQLNCMECNSQLPNDIKNNRSKLQVICLECGTINNLIEFGSKDNLVKLKIIGIEEKKINL